MTIFGPILKESMKYILSISLLTTFFFNLSFAQVNYKITSYNPTAQVFKNLLQTNSKIEANDSVNEEILDLVTPIVADSLLGRKKEHHQLFLVGWLIHARSEERRVGKECRSRWSSGRS